MVFREGEGRFYAVYKVIHDVTNFLPRMIDLIKQEEPPSAIVKGSKEDSSHLGVIKLILAEPTGQHSKPERLVQAFLSVRKLYEVVAELEGVSADTLTVTSCDSGSDKTFDFLGVAKAITSLKELLLSLWDRVVFFREKQLAQRLDLVATSLPILERITALQQSQALGPEQAEIMRRKVIDGVGEFLETGSTIPEMNGRSRFEPRQLMAPEPKLLTTGDGISERGVQEEALTPEEKMLLEELQKKAGKANPS